MRVVNEQPFSKFSQRPVGGIEKRVCTHIIQWSDPLPFQYSPKRFCNVQMRGIGRQIEKEKSSFLPEWAQLLHFMIAVYSSIIKYDKRLLMYTHGECIQKADHLVCGDTFRSSEALIVVLAVNHPEDVKSCGSLGYDAYLLSGQLPTVGDIPFSANMALIRIVEGNTSLTFLLFKFLQLLALVCIELRRGCSPWAFPYTLISCAKADKNA